VRSYNQFCATARALDVVGERWTLLVIRELMFGPKRYTDLQAGLPGIGPNILAARLRSLESAGVIRKRHLPPPAASTVYELSELGEGLRPVVLSLFEWGLQLVTSPGGEDAIKASYWLPAIQQAARADLLPEATDDLYEFRIDGETITVHATNDRIEVRQGAAPAPDLVIQTDAWTFIELGRGETTAAAAVKAGKLSIQGDPEASERCATLFGTRRIERLGTAA
jgi:DNA-binding HxlR family transcriptional regulator/putative sterol carrier protein